jgi:hypothetical protein
VVALISALAFPGLLAPSPARGVIGVQPLDALARPAATVLIRQVQASQTLRAIRIDTDPSASDCTNKPYVAAARLASTVIHGDVGWTVDMGLVLVDCAGWNVDEFHENEVLAHSPTDVDAEKLGMSLSLRFTTWRHMEPAFSSALLASGLAYDPATKKPTYFYRLFKTDDGNMRAFVRPGGPAYVAGLRTNDVVQKLDGKYWWEYGTYQTEQRAYDGKPHSFEVTRGKQSVRIQLGEPYKPG